MVADLTLDKAMLKDEGSRETSNPGSSAQRCEVESANGSGYPRDEPVPSLVNHDRPNGWSPNSERTTPMPRSPRSYVPLPSPILARATERPIGQF